MQRVGAKPRVELYPAYDYSLGFAAVELMAAAGKELDAWQVDACEIMMAQRDGKWACSEYCEWTARQNGKGALLEARALGGLFLFDEELIAWSAHEYKTAMEAFRRCKTLIRALGLPGSNPNLIEVVLDEDTLIRVKVNNTNGEESFERLDTGQRIKFVARSKGSGRGFTAPVQIIDEAFAYTAQHQDALAPTQLATVDEQTIYMSTPPLTGATGEVMYSLRARAEKGGDDTLGYRDWGMGFYLEDIFGKNDKSKLAMLEDQAVWHATNPALGGRISVDRMVKLRRKLGATGFARESLGAWPKQVAFGNDVIDPQTWAARGDADSRPGEALVLGIDASPGGRSAAVASAGRREDDRLHAKVMDYRPGTGWVVERVKELVGRHRPRRVMLDPAGPAGALIADLTEALTNDRGELIVEIELVGGLEMTQACGALINDLTEDRIRHCNQDALNDAVAQATSRRSADSWKWDRRDSSGDICPLVAVTVATHGFRLYGAEDTGSAVPLVAWR